jgi:hypothetical protein
MTVVFFVWPAEQFAAQIITTAYGIPLGDLIQIAVTNPHLSDHGRAGGCQIVLCVKASARLTQEQNCGDDGKDISRRGYPCP